jgi:hypothetical protein
VGTEQVGFGEAFGDEAFNGAFEVLDARVGQGGAIRPHRGCRADVAFGCGRFDLEIFE